MRKNKGFTLIEIIVVLVVLATLAAVAIPVLTGIINQSKVAICKNDRGVIRRLYQASASSYVYNVKEPMPLIQTLVDDYEGTAFNSTEYLSKCGGICTIEYGENNGSIKHIYCSLHDPTEKKVSNPYSGYDKSGLDRALAGIRAISANDEILAVVNEYIKKRPNTDTLDSSGVNFAIKMNPVLTSYGFVCEKNEDNSFTEGWRMIIDRKKKTYDIYWTDHVKYDEPVRYARIKFNYEENKQIGNIETGTLNINKCTPASENKYFSLDVYSRTVDATTGNSWIE